MDTGLDENQAELGVLVLAVALEVLADSDGLEHRWLALRSRLVHAKFDKTYLLDQHVKVLWDFWCEACNHSVSL